MKTTTNLSNDTEAVFHGDGDIVRAAGYIFAIAVMLQMIFFPSTLVAWELIPIILIAVDVVIRAATFVAYSVFQFQTWKILDIDYETEVSRQNEALKKKKNKHRFDAFLLNFRRGLHRGKANLYANENLAKGWDDTDYKAEARKRGSSWKKLAQFALEEKKLRDTTKKFVDEADSLNLPKEDATYLQRTLIRQDFTEARRHLNEVREKKEAARKEVQEIKERAEEANCLPVLIQHFERGSFDPGKAEELITIAKHLRSQAEKYGVEESVIEAYQVGDLQSAKSIVAEAEKAEEKKKRQEEMFSNLENRISNLPSIHQPELRGELHRIFDAYEFESRDFRKAHYELVNAIEEAEEESG